MTTGSLSPTDGAAGSDGVVQAGQRRDTLLEADQLVRVQLGEPMTHAGRAGGADRLHQRAPGVGQRHLAGAAARARRSILLIVIMMERRLGRPTRRGRDAVHGAVVTETAVTAQHKPVPEPDDASRGFWAAANEHRLMIQRCAACGFYLYPPD